MSFGRPNRRSLLTGLLSTGLVRSGLSQNRPNRGKPDTPERNQNWLRMRVNAAVAQSRGLLVDQANSGDESVIGGYVGCFTKGLPHSQTGLVDANAYRTLLQALVTGRHADFENISRGSGMKLVNPQAAFTYEMEGLDSHQLACPPAPGFSSPDAAAEMVE